MWHHRERGGDAAGDHLGTHVIQSGSIGTGEGGSEMRDTVDYSYSGTEVGEKGVFRSSQSGELRRGTGQSGVYAEGERRMGAAEAGAGTETNTGTELGPMSLSSRRGLPSGLMRRAAAVEAARWRELGVTGPEPGAGGIPEGSKRASRLRSSRRASRGDVDLESGFMRGISPEMVRRRDPTAGLLPGTLSRGASGSSASKSCSASSSRARPERPREGGAIIIMLLPAGLLLRTLASAELKVPRSCDGMMTGRDDSGGELRSGREEEETEEGAVALVAGASSA